QEFGALRGPCRRRPGLMTRASRCQKAAQGRGNRQARVHDSAPGHTVQRRQQRQSPASVVLIGSFRTVLRPPNEYCPEASQLAVYTVSALGPLPRRAFVVASRAYGEDGAVADQRPEDPGRVAAGREEGRSRGAHAGPRPDAHAGALAEILGKVPHAAAQPARAARRHAADQAGRAHRSPEGLEAAENGAAARAPLVVAVGGDGTLNEVVNGVRAAGRGTPVGAVLTGRGCDASRNFGVPRDPIAAVRALADGRDRQLDLGRAEWGDGRRRW